MLLWLTLAILVGALAFGISRLRFVEDIGSFFPKNADNERVNYAYQHIGSDNRIVLNIKQKSTSEEVDCDLLAEVADSLAERLTASDAEGFIKDILYEVEQQQLIDITNFVVRNMPLFLEEKDYERLDTILQYDKISKQLAYDRDEILSAPVGFLQDVILGDPLFISGPVLKKLENFKLSDQYQEMDGHIFDKEGKEAIVVVSSRFPVSETKNNAVLISRINDAKAAVEKQFDNQVEISAFGASLISQTNSKQIKRDSIWAVALSLFFILGLLIYYYRNLKSILLILCTITFGGLLAMGAIVLFKNPISIIAVGVASIIVGIAINYPIHFLSHFKRTNDKEQIIKDIVNPLLIGNITTVGAFLSLLFISSDAMRDLGLFAALLLVGTILFVLVFLPHLLGRRPEHWQTAELSFKHVAEFHPENHPWIVTLVCALTILFFIFSFQTSFETNLHKINYMTAEQRSRFEQLVAETDTTVLTMYCVAEGATTDQALEAYEKASPIIEKFPESEVLKTNGVSVFLPSQQMQQERIARWNRFWESRREVFLKEFARAAAENGYSDEAFEDFYSVICGDFHPQPLDYFSPIADQLASSYVVKDSTKSLVYTILSVDKKSVDTIAVELNSVDDNIFAFSDSSIISRMITALSGDFDYVLFICGFIVFVFLLFSFGRLEIALTAFLPLTIAWIWILGIMGICDLKFNIVNIILATFIFGQGDDYAIFVTEGVMYEYRTGKKMLSQFKNSIILSSSIMFIGIGMLIFAKHPAMRSLAEVTIIGMTSVVMMAYIFPPFIFKWLTTSKGMPRRFPITIWNLTKTIVSFTVFLLITIPLSAWSLFCLAFFRRNRKMKASFHRFLSRLFRLLAQMMPQVRYTVHNKTAEDFSKPALLIANHQSHLDLLYTMMLSQKIVVLTNRWVWHCPFYRWIIRYADCLPVDDGLEQNLPKLRQLVADGYSILVFPEGTRSADCRIGRFHQGAFALADALNLRIVPIVLHGVGHVLPKREFILHKGSVDVAVMPAIETATLIGEQPENSRAATRAIRKQFQQAYEQLCAETETADYFRDLLKANYLYKGTEVAKHARRQMRDFESWKARIAAMPDSGTFEIRDCGQGEFALLAALVKKQLQITAFDSDEELIAIATNCAAVPDNLHYVCEKTTPQTVNEA